MTGHMWWIAVILGIVEGLTEFLPISSTGHLIIAGHYLGYTGDVANTFEIAIQLGAILAVLAYYRTKIATLLMRSTADAESRRLLLGLGLAFLPAAALGLLTHRWIKAYLFNTTTVAWALIVGGVLMLLIERSRLPLRAGTLEETTLRQALGVGLAQCASLFPGISRSGATIMGGLLAGMNRTVATEYSFFLAIPTMGAATLYDLAQNLSLFTRHDLALLAVGFATSFFVALLVVHGLLGYVKRHTFAPFAYYRILFGMLVLALALTQGA
ncbi:MAG: undecaprenyl-diphosphate phosphatase [Nitrospirota bacterium]